MGVANESTHAATRRIDVMKLVRWYPLQDWVPPVDVFEQNDQLVIRAEVPGVQKADLDVRIENGVLTLHGERKRETDVTEANAFRLERTHGAFTRSFSLPRTVDGASVTAAYKDGILEVRVPKAESAKPKKVEIQAA
jgi:HSP20 family protein